MMTAESIDRLVLAMVEASKQPTLALAAMAYARAGVAVFPTKPRTKVPLHGSRGHLDATTDLDQVEEWWAKHPEANIACSPGRSGLLVIDVDGPSREQEDGTTKLVADGRKTWRKLREAAKDTSGSFTTLSPGKGKGQHAWYLYPPGRRVGAPKLLDAPGLQAFGVLGYVMLPPSVHPDGPRYAFDAGCYEVTEVPEWLLRRIPESSTADAPNATDDVVEEFIGARSVNDLDAFWRVAVEAEADSVRDADLRHPALLSSLAKVIGWSTRENVFDLDKALTILRDALRDAVGNEAARSPDKEFRSALKWVVGHELAEIATEQKTLETSKNDEWPALKPLEPPASSAPLEQLPPVIRGVVDTVSAHTQTPPEHALLACLSTISAATVGNAIIDLGWHEPGSVWTVSVAEPSDRKSSVLALITSTPIATAMSVVKDGLAPQVLESEAKAKAAAARLAAVEKGMQKDSPTSTPMDWSQARAELDEVEQVVVPAFLITDATPESIEIAMENQNGAASAVSAEGDLISSLAGRYSDKQARVGPLNSAWSGEPIYIHRVKGNRSIPEPHLSMTMIVQPTVLHKMGSTSLFTESGFAARFLYAKPASKVGYRGSNSPELDGSAVTRWTTTVTEVLSRFWGAKAKTVLSIDREGARAITSLRDRVELMLQGKRIPAATRYWLGKAVGQVGRVALMMALSDDPQANSVDVEYVDRAIALFDFFYAEASATFGATIELEGVDIEHAESIARWLKESKGVSKLQKQDGFYLLSPRDLTRYGPGKYRRASEDDRFSALTLLEDACYVRYIRPSGQAPTSRGGHPVQDRWVVSPKAVSTPSGGRSAAVLSSSAAASAAPVSAAQEVVQQVQQPRNIQREEKGGWGGVSVGGSGDVSLFPSLYPKPAAQPITAGQSPKNPCSGLAAVGDSCDKTPLPATDAVIDPPDGYETWDEYCNPNLFRKPINAHVAEGYPKLHPDGSCSRCGSAQVHKLNGFVVCTACRTSYTAMVISGE